MSRTRREVSQGGVLGSECHGVPAVFLCPMNPSELCRLEEAGYQWTEGGYALPAYTRRELPTASRSGGRWRDPTRAEPHEHDRRACAAGELKGGQERGQA